MKCSICKEEIPVKEGGWSTGNNAQPINDGRCCDACNMNVVIPARLHAVSNRHEEEEEEHWLYLLSHGGYARVVGADDNWTTAHQLTGETGRLFAAAPEMLAGLRRILLKQQTGEDDFSVARLCLNLIRKAEGSGS